MPDQRADGGWSETVAVLLQQALARAQSMGEEALAGLGVSGREYGVLAVLGDGASTVQHRVGAVLGIDRTTTMTLVAGLEARGLVQRSRDLGDRRAYLLQLTVEGDRLRGRAAQELAACEERFLAPLPGDERDRLRVTLQRLV